MMETPICDFVRRYCQDAPLRMHMPGHKGIPLLGMEALDITEIPGADSLYEASGIIKESEAHATALFGSGATFYSTEGSSHCIRAMLFLASLSAKAQNRPFRILAARNAHKTFITAAGLLDADVVWLPPAEHTAYLSAPITDFDALEAALMREQPTALYLTSPDYLGVCADLEAASAVCKKHGVLLLVDHAHGAYLKFLPQSRHPMDLGADLCCDSAHKTLPALTGAAYLHLSKHLPPFFREQAKDALALFGSTSPSYLILQSLDAVNRYLADTIRARLAAFLPEAENAKAELSAHGYAFLGDEPLKWTIAPKDYGYRGDEFAELLAERGVVCEFADPDFVVFMLSCEAGLPALRRLSEVLLSVPRKEPIAQRPPRPHLPERVMTIREALFAARETVPAAKSAGRILSALNVSCPPAVPIAVCGERIDEEAAAMFRYYGIKECSVVCEPKD